MGGGGGISEQLVPALRPVKTEETVSQRQNNSVKEVGTPPVQSSLCTALTAVSTAVRNKLTETVSGKRQLKPEAEGSPTHDESPAPPPSSWSLHELCEFRLDSVVPYVHRNRESY